MGTRYTWTKALITTENRDRPGGHGNTYATDGMGYNEPYSPAGAKFLKRRTRRGQRREHARITREAVSSFYEDQRLDLLDTIDYSSADDFNEWYSEHQFDYEEDHNDNPFDDYYEDYSYDPYPYDPYYNYDYPDGYYSARAYAREEDPHDRIIKHEDIGKSLGEILEEIQARKV